ncbi:hypothetical protein [Bacillus thuringiensis]
MEQQSELSLFIVAVVICTAVLAVHWIDIWDKKTGWSKDVKR